MNYKGYTLTKSDIAELIKVCEICKFKKKCKKFILLKSDKLKELCLLHKSILKLCIKKIKSKEGKE